MQRPLVQIPKHQVAKPNVSESLGAPFLLNSLIPPRMKIDLTIFCTSGQTIAYRVQSPNRAKLSRSHRRRRVSQSSSSRSSRLRLAFPMDHGISASDGPPVHGQATVLPEGRSASSCSSKWIANSRCMRPPIFARTASHCFRIDIWTATALSALCIRDYFMFQPAMFDHRLWVVQLQRIRQKEESDTILVQLPG